MKSKYMKAILIEKKTKTNVYGLVSARDYDIDLGVVKWYAPWRQYCFFPDRDTVFSPGCIADIIQFIKELMDERKVQRSKVNKNRDSLPTRKPDVAHQVGASPENQDRVLKEIDPKRRE